MEVAEIHVDSPSPRTGLRSAPRVIPPRPNRPGTAWDCSGHVPKYTRGSSTSSLSAPSPRSDDRAAQISAAQCAAHIVRKRAIAAARLEKLAALEEARIAARYQQLAESFAGKRSPRPYDYVSPARDYPLSDGTKPPPKSPYYYSFDMHLRATTPQYASSQGMIQRKVEQASKETPRRQGSSRLAKRPQMS